MKDFSKGLAIVGMFAACAYAVSQNALAGMVMAFFAAASISFMFGDKEEK